MNVTDFAFFYTSFCLSKIVIKAAIETKLKFNTGLFDYFHCFDNLVDRIIKRLFTEYVFTCTSSFHNEITMNSCRCANHDGFDFGIIQKNFIIRDSLWIIEIFRPFVILLWIYITNVFQLCLWNLCHDVPDMYSTNITCTNDANDCLLHDHNLHLYTSYIHISLDCTFITNLCAFEYTDELSMRMQKDFPFQDPVPPLPVATLRIQYHLRPGILLESQQSHLRES